MDAVNKQASAGGPSVVLVAFALVVVATSLAAVAAPRYRPDDELPTLPGWALAGRSFGPAAVWFLLGGTIFTAYTFTAVPGLVYGTGAFGFFALPYTVLICPLALLLAPRLWRAARAVGAVTAADLVQAHTGSSALALAVAVTGFLATMPYIALQLLGIRATLTAAGAPADGLVGDLVLTAVFAVLARATYRSGMRAPALIAVVKAALLFPAIVLVVAVAVGRVGGVETAFAAAARRGGPEVLAPPPSAYGAYATLALGSALALLLYPHVLSAVFAASSPRALRRAVIALPAWTLLLGLFALLGVAALAAGVVVPAGRGELAVPVLVVQVLPEPLAGAVLGALAMGALVPAAVMSIGAAALFARNIYVPYVQPGATPKTETEVARLVSLAVKVGGLVFVFGLQPQYAINLQLLGGIWILQTLPAVLLTVCRWQLSAGGLLAGWAAGMVTGTGWAASGGFSSVISVGVGPLQVQGYAALAALAVNLAVIVGWAASTAGMASIARAGDESRSLRRAAWERPLRRDEERTDGHQE